MHETISYSIVHEYIKCNRYIIIILICVRIVTKHIIWMYVGSHMCSYERMILVY